MLHYLNPTDKSTWPPRNSYFYAKLKGEPYWNDPVDRYILYHEYYDFLKYNEKDYFIEAGGEQCWEIMPEEIEYWLSFDELDKCIKFFEENSQQKI